MGIKFHCPNGHKLNVKAFLAGKKGVCPKCGTKLRIPAASEPGLGDDDGEDSDAGKQVASLPGNGAAPQSPAIPTANIPAAVQPAQPVPVPTPVAVPVTAVRAVTAVPVPSPAIPAMPLPAAGPAASRPPTAGDPISEAPMAIWYVRPPSGGQFGPARGDVMRKWIAEGRVSSDSLVWREGWTDWQNAGKLFPHLQAAGNPATPAAIAPAARTTRSVNRHQAKKSGGNSMGVAILIFLAIVCVVLVAVLAVVLFNMNAAPKT